MATFSKRRFSRREYYHCDRIDAAVPKTKALHGTFDYAQCLLGRNVATEKLDSDALEHDQKI